MEGRERCRDVRCDGWWNVVRWAYNLFVTITVVLSRYVVTLIIKYGDWSASKVNGFHKDS